MKDKFHFIAIGGIGQSGLAKMLLQNGYEVSGSDKMDNKYLNPLRDLGAKIYIGHNGQNVQAGMTIVVSTAIKPNNPELIRANELGLKIIHRSDLLKRLAEESGQIFIGFCGTHGKTTTSGFCAYLLECGGYDPSFCIGGIVPGFDTNAKIGKGKYFVAELDESDGTITKYSPDFLVINNLEPDHHEFYTGGLEQLLETFDKTISNLKPSSKIIANAGSLAITKLNNYKKFVTFGFESGSYITKNITLFDDSSEFQIEKDGHLLEKVKLSIPGNHNVINATAVITVLNEAGVDLEKIRSFYEKFTGMGRRFQHVCQFNDIDVIDDYAHHPCEIKAALACAKNMAKARGKRLVAIFQPHRYTRFKELWEDFTCAFSDADVLMITDVFAAGDEHDSVYNSENFQKALKHNDAHYIKGNMNKVSKNVTEILKNDDLVILLGAGDITDLGKTLKDDYLNDYKNKY